MSYWTKMVTPPEQALSRVMSKLTEINTFVRRCSQTISEATSYLVVIFMSCKRATHRLMSSVPHLWWREQSHECIRDRTVGVYEGTEKFWLMPILVVLLSFGALIVFTQDSAVAPFIYTLLGIERVECVRRWLLRSYPAGLDLVWF
jgi:hypothetical protein